MSRSKWFFGSLIVFALFGFYVALTSSTGLRLGVDDGSYLARRGEFIPVTYTPPEYEPPTGDDFETLIRVNRALQQVVTHVRDSVVAIETTTKPKPSSGEGRESPHGFNPWERLFPGPELWPRGEKRGIGSGVIISEDGYILTNNHVVEDADRIVVVLSDKRDFDAELVGRDPRTDLAVIKIDAKNLPAMPIGDSEKLGLGEFVIAIGAPFGHEHSVSFGIVSAKGRSDIIRRLRPELAPYEDFIQTDAAINPGNSGGPLVNIRGELIGINTAISTNTGQSAGIGFAISSNLAKKVMKDLIERGKVVRAWLGVWLQDVDDDVAEKLGLDRPQGALVSRVQKDSPAEKAGLQPFDLILSVDGNPMEDMNHVRNYISSSNVGQTVTLGILRDGKEIEIKVKLGELDEEMIAAGTAEDMEADGNWTGLIVETLTPEKAEELGYEEEEGVLVTGVRRDSPAYAEGIQVGTLIIEVDRQPVTTRREFVDAVSNAGNSVLLKWLINDRRTGIRYGMSVLKRHD